MALETGTYISSLVATNPASTDLRSEGDNHLRLIKSTILATFPSVTGAVTPTHTELNYVDGVTSSIQTQFNAKTYIFTVRTIASDVNRHCFIAPAAMTLTKVETIFSTSAAGAALDLYKTTGTQAPSAGVALTTAAATLSGTTNTVVTSTLTATGADLIFAAGNRVSIGVGGTTNATAIVTFTFTY